MSETTTTPTPSPAQALALAAELRELGVRLKSLRKKHKMTLQDASAKAEISLSFLSDVERNRTPPSLKTLFSLARIYGTTASKLLEQ